MRTTERALGLLSTLVIVGLVGIGGWALVQTYVLETPTDPLLTPTAVTLALTVGVVLVLIGLGVGSSHRLENPYW